MPVLKSKLEDIMRAMEPGETRYEYLMLVRAFTRKKFVELANTPEYKYSHPSHAVAHAMRLAEAEFCDLGTFGVEGTTSDYGQDPINLQYLNTGDSYELTLCYFNFRFLIASVGDLIEAHATPQD